VSSGQTPSDENYRCVAPDDCWAQYLHVINNRGIQLAAAGATWDDVVDKRTFTLDVDDAQQGHARSRNPGSVESRTPSTEHTRWRDAAVLSRLSPRRRFDRVTGAQNQESGIGT
jgi:enamine deaminase RidA (YjgF/YER057c/UK114 family)